MSPQIDSASTFFPRGHSQENLSYVREWVSLKAEKVPKSAFDKSAIRAITHK